MSANAKFDEGQVVPLISCNLPGRFWFFVQPEPMSGCWLWTGAWSKPRHGANHGQFWYQGRLRGPHRVLYEAVRGPIGPGLDLDHLCRTPPCVRPNHLEPVTSAENVARGNRDRGAFPHTKIGPADVRLLIDLYGQGATTKALAERFGVYRTTITEILRKWRGPAPPRFGSSRFRGVYLARRSGRWRAQLTRNRKAIYLGSFATEEEAAACVAAAQDLT